MISADEREWWRRQHMPARSGPSRAVSQGRHADTDSPTAFWSMVAFTGVLLLSPQAHFPGLIPFRIAFCAAFISIAAYVSHRMRRRESILMASREIRVALYLAGWTLLTIPLGLWPGGSANGFVDQYSKALIIFCLLSGLLSTT